MLYNYAHASGYNRLFFLSFGQFIYLIKQLRYFWFNYLTSKIFSPEKEYVLKKLLFWFPPLTFLNTIGIEIFFVDTVLGPAIHSALPPTMPRQKRTTTRSAGVHTWASVLPEPRPAPEPPRARGRPVRSPEPRLPSAPNPQAPSQWGRGTSPRDRGATAARRRGSRWTSRRGT